MPEEITTDTDVTITGNRPDIEMTTIKLDNREITVPKDAAEILKQAESEIKSGYDRKLREEREALESEKAKQNDLLMEDIQWLNDAYANYPEAVKYYDPKFNGGRGYTGDTALLKSNTPTSAKPDIKTDVLGNPETLELKKAIENMKLQINSLKETSENTVEGVMETRDKLKSKYPNADLKAVNAELELHYRKTGKHASDKLIEEVIKASHDYVMDRISKTAIIDKKPGKSATPPAGGDITTPSSKKIPPLGSPEFLKLVESELGG